MRRFVTMLLVASALGIPEAARAQVPGIDIQLVPKVGLYSPASDLTDAAEAGAQFAEERSGSLAVGLGLDLALPFSPVDFRVGFDYVTSSRITFEDELTTEESTVDQQMLALAADVVFRPLPRMVVAQPYVLAGAGVKRYDFEAQDVAAGLEAFDESVTDFALHAGMGLDVGFGPLAIVAEVSDYVSWFELEGSDDSEMQHDLFFMAGIRVGMF